MSHPLTQQSLKFYGSSTIWGRKPVRLLSSQGLKDGKGPTKPKGRSPLTPLGIQPPS